MENTEIRPDETRRGRPARNGGHAAERGSEWKNLVSDVEDLVKKVANVDDAEIAEIRSRVEDTLAKAKTTAGARLEAVRDRAVEVTDVTDAYVRDNPWAVVGIAAAVGIVIGFMAGRR